VDSTTKNASIGWVIAGIVCSSLALFFGTGLHPHWWLTWLMPISVLLVAARSSALGPSSLQWFPGSWVA
jgi:apolipoprotein N-acyltransferase